MIQNFRPMLAVQAKGPLQHDDFVISPKYDGIRCLIRDSFPVSRTLKPIPNKFVQQMVGDYSLEGFDGELIVGSPTAPDVYNVTNSGVMSADGEPDFKFYVFDYVDCDLATPFKERHAQLIERIEYLDPEFRKHVELVPQIPVANESEIRYAEERFLEEGYEGAMLRRLSSPYKLGRSTEKQGWLLKLKRFSDSEARILGFECMYSNQNEATVDALGHTERSSHKAGLVPLDTLGKLVVRDIYSDVEFSIGSGFTATQRKELWDARDTLIGKLVKYKFFNIGVVDKPRFPIFLGFREEADL